MNVRARTMSFSLVDWNLSLLLTLDRGEEQGGFFLV